MSFTPYFYDVSVANAVDYDGDGYVRQFDISFDVDSNIAGDYYVILREEAGDYDPYIASSITYSVNGAVSDYHSFTVWADATGPDLSHGTANFYLQLVDASTNNVVQTWTQANDSSLGPRLVELGSEDQQNFGAGDIPSNTTTGGVLAVDGGSLSGTVHGAGDQDWYQVELLVGHQYQFELQGAASAQGTLDNPAVRVVDDSGYEWAYSESTGADASLIFTPLWSGTWYVSAEAITTSTGTYTLSATEVDIPGDLLTGVYLDSFGSGASVTGTVDVAQDQDWYLVWLDAGHTYVIDLQGQDSGQGTLDDPVVQLLDYSGGAIAFDDDSGTGLDSRIIYTPASSDLYYVSAQGFADSTGTFTLSLYDGGGGAPGAAFTPSFYDVDISDLVDLDGDGYAREFQLSFDVDSNIEGEFYVDVYVEYGAGDDTIDGGAGDDTVFGGGFGFDSYVTSSPTFTVNGAVTDYQTLTINADAAGPVLSHGTAQFVLYLYDANTYELVQVWGQDEDADLGSQLIELGSEDQQNFGPGDAPANASTTGVLAVGASLAGTVSGAGDQDWYQIELIRGHQYQFDLGGGTLVDPDVRLVDAFGYQVAPYGSLDSSFTFIPYESGTYYVSAQGGGVSTGTYVLSATELDISGNIYSGAYLSMFSGSDSLTGTVDFAGDQDWYGLYLYANHQYVIDLQGAASGEGTLVDPFVRLVDFSGNELAFDDDSGSGLDSQLTYTVASTGYYYVSAQAFGSATGTFTLSVHDTEIAGNTSTTGVLVVDDSVTGLIDPAYDSDWYQVTLVAGHEYVFDLQGAPSGMGTLADPSLQLYDSSGYWLDYDYDSGLGVESSMHYVAGYSGTYYVSASGGFTGGTGTFTLSATDLGIPFDAVPGDASTTETIDVGSSVAGTLEFSGDHDWYQVTLVAGQNYIFELLGAPSGSGTLGDPLLVLLNASGNQVGYSDDSGGTLESRITYEAPSSGTYYLSAQGFAEYYSGTYTLSATDAETLGSEVPSNLHLNTVQIEGALEAIILSVVVDADGSIIAVGGVLTDKDIDIVLIRFNADGSRDSDFGVDGVVRTDLDGGSDWATQVGLLPGGGIAITGYDGDETGNSSFFVALYTADGVLDPGYSDDGVARIDQEPGYGFESAGSMVVQPNGMVVAGGASSSLGALDFMVARFQTDGVLDTAFSGDGIVMTATGLEGYISSMALEPDGQILVAGDVLVDDVTYEYDFAVARYNTSGALDASFGDDGIVLVPVGFDAYVATILLQPDGGMIVAGTADYGFVLVRLLEDGSVDTAFGGNGVAYSGFGFYSFMGAAALQEDGRIVVAGETWVDGNWDLVVARFEANGALDTSFNGTGSLIADLSHGGDDIVTAIAVREDGSIVIGGSSAGSAVLGLLILGTEADDDLVGGVGDDTVVAFSGNDTLDGALGSDSMEGGSGNDYYYVDDEGDVVFETNNNPVGEEGPRLLHNEGGTVDTVDAGIDYILGTYLENLLQSGGLDIDGIGNSLDNFLRGNVGANVLDGLGGNDSIMGELGADTLGGGQGLDTIDGGAGDDWILGGRGSDSIFGLAGADHLEGSPGFDTIQGGTGNDSVYGGQAGDVLYGNRGGDLLDGGLGADSVYGAQGADLLIGGTGGDYLEGNFGIDTLNGGAGDDTMSGGGGIDRFVYTSTLLGTGDVTAGGQDQIFATTGDVVDLQLLLANTVDEIAVVGTTIQIDVNNDGTFNALQDFQITVTGVTSVTFQAADGLFHLA
jgi:uncharacterized delta-60 repeat protein